VCPTTVVARAPAIQHGFKGKAIIAAHCDNFVIRRFLIYFPAATANSLTAARFIIHAPNCRGDGVPKRCWRLFQICVRTAANGNGGVARNPDPHRPHRSGTANRLAAWSPNNAPCCILAVVNYGAVTQGFRCPKRIQIRLRLPGCCGLTQTSLGPPVEMTMAHLEQVKRVTALVLEGLSDWRTTPAAFLSQSAFLAKHCHGIHAGRPACRKPGRQQADKGH